MQEEFRTIKGFENYEISNYGKVKPKSSPIEGCYNTCVNHGYVIVSLYIDHKRYKKQVHRLLAEAFLDGYEKRFFVKHIDGNKTNNVISNLQLTHRGRSGELVEKVENEVDNKFIKYYPKTNRWRVEIEIKKDEYNCLGFFKSIEDAKLARDNRIKEIHNLI
jgi:hypothetical protein